MKRLLVIIGILFWVLPLIGQEIQDSTRRVSDIRNMQINLERYYEQRQVASSIIVYSFLCAGAGTLDILLREPGDHLGAIVAYSMTSISLVAGFIVYVDAEKWLKKATISISPGTLRITF